MQRAGPRRRYIGAARAARECSHQTVMVSLNPRKVATRAAPVMIAWNARS
jgi:hypothetical protein